MIQKYLLNAVNWINDINEFWFLEARKYLFVNIFFVIQLLIASLYNGIVFNTLREFDSTNPVVFLQYIYQTPVYIAGTVLLGGILLTKNVRFIHWVNNIMLFFLMLLGTGLLFSGIKLLMIFSGIHYAYSGIIFLYLNDDDIRKWIINKFAQRGTRKYDKTGEQ